MIYGTSQARRQFLKSTWALMRSVTKEVVVEIEGWDKNVRNFVEHGDYMDLVQRQDQNKEEC